MTDERKDFLWSVFVTALEGGIGYWSVAVEYHWSTGDGDTIDFETFGATIHETDEDGEELYTVDRAAIQRGIGRIIDNKVQIASSLREHIKKASRDNDAGMIDSGDADCIVQAGVLGDIIYG